MKGMTMQTRPPASADDRSCPLAFLVTAAFASSLVWLYTLLGHVVTR
jgi:hypothetical protein